MYLIRATRALGLTCLLGLPIMAEDQVEVEFSRPTFTAFHEFGRFEKAISENVLDLEAMWVHRTGAFMEFSATKEKRLGMDLKIGGTYYTPTLAESDRQTRIRFFAASVPKLNVHYVLGDPESPFLRIDGGIFEYKYNEYARNLGEYAFRTGTYPSWIATGGLTYVGVNKVALTGLKLSNRLGGNFSHDLILNLETEVLPNYDLSITYMGKLNLGNVLKVGGGVQFARIMPAAPSKTNADKPGNRFFTYQNKTYIDRTEYYAVRIEAVKQRGTALDDTLQYTQALAVLAGIEDSSIAKPDYQHYNATGIKPLLYASFDPKPLFNASIFGPNDLVIYGEAALLGFKDYPILYEKKAERIPMMLGINIPTFKLLDVFAYEIERFPNKLPNSIRQVMNSGYPQPTLPPIGGYDPEEWTKDDIKWSLFAQRKIVNGVSIQAQVARDHARGYQYPTGKTDWTLFPEKKDWYWMAKFVVNI